MYVLVCIMDAYKMRRTNKRYIIQVTLKDWNSCNYVQLNHIIWNLSIYSIQNSWRKDWCFFKPIFSLHKLSLIIFWYTISRLYCNPFIHRSILFGRSTKLDSLPNYHNSFEMFLSRYHSHLVALQFKGLNSCARNFNINNNNNNNNNNKQFTVLTCLLF